MIGPGLDEPVRVDPLAELARREEARHDRDAVGPVFGEGPQADPLASGIALARDDDHAIPGVARLLLERGGDLAVDRVAHIGQEEPEGPGPTDPQAACCGVRNVVEIEGGGLDELARREADPWVVGERP